MMGITLRLLQPLENWRTVKKMIEDGGITVALSEVTMLPQEPIWNWDDKVRCSGVKADRGA